MDKEILVEAGLTRNETDIYMQLLKSGISSSGPIISQTGIANSRVYVSLDSLIRKGLVSYVIKNNVKHFRAEDPRILLKNMEQKKKRLSKIVPELKGLQNLQEDQKYSSIFEGINGFKSAFQYQIDHCKEGEEIDVIGLSPQTYAFGTLRRFLKTIDRKRYNKKVNLKILLDEESRTTIGKDREKEPYTEVRYMPQEYVSPAGMNIFKDHVMILVWEKKPTVFMIKNEKVFQSFNAYFQMLWNMSR